MASWLNNSLSSIKGQLTSLAQEVLAETEPEAESGEEERQSKTVEELLVSTQQQKEELETICKERENEILQLRRQIKDLKNKNDNGNNGSKSTAAGSNTRSQKTPPEHNTSLEDSWYWEPDDINKNDNDHSNSETSSGNSNELVKITLDEVPLEDASSKAAKRAKQSDAEFAALRQRVQQLEEENGRLNASLEELDSLHNVVIQDMLKQKNNLQQQLKTLTNDSEVVKQEFTNKVMNALEEINNLKELLAKKDKDNQELIARIKETNEEVEKAHEERIELMQRLKQLESELEDGRPTTKHKKNSESISSSTSKQSEDEFIVVREGDEAMRECGELFIQEELKSTIARLEDRLSELVLENQALLAKLQESEILQEKEADAEVKKDSAELEQLQMQLNQLLSEKDNLERQLQGLRNVQDNTTELEGRIQRLTLENQQLRLNAEAENEILNNSAELEEKLKNLSDENCFLRNELEIVRQTSFSAAIAEEKQEITDLDAEADEDENFSLSKLNELLDVYIKKEHPGEIATNAEKMFKSMQRKMSRIDELQKNLAQMSDEIIDLQNSKIEWDHEKKTLEADISQYVLQCNELMKNNEILLNELENLKCKKLDTIHENNEDHLFHLECQLEENVNANRRLKEEYSELNKKFEAVVHEKQDLTERLQAMEQIQENMVLKEKELSATIEALQIEKETVHKQLQCAERTESGVSLEAHKHLEAQLKSLNEDHAELVNALQKEKAALTAVTQKYEDATKSLQDERDKQDVINKELKELQQKCIQSVEDYENQLHTLKEQNTQLKADALAKDIVVEHLKTQLLDLEQQVEAYEISKQTNSELKLKLEDAQLDLAALQEQYAALKKSTADAERLGNENFVYKKEIEELLEHITKLEKTTQHLEAQHQAQTQELERLQDQLQKSNTDNHVLLSRIAELETKLLDNDVAKTLDTLTYEKNELIAALEQKHAENMQYYTEIQRLQAIVVQQQQQQAANESRPCEKCALLETNIIHLKSELEKVKDQANFLKEKSDMLTTNLLAEQGKRDQERACAEEKYNAVSKDLERLREHLVEIEDLHTQEAMQMQKELEETRSVAEALQAQVSKSNNAYTSASIRTNQQLETLQAQYAIVVQQRDELVTKLSLCEDRELKNQAALCNLQCALEQFQNEKENDIKIATQRIRKEFAQELEKEVQLRNEIATLKRQLEDANQGLLAASRLSDKLEVNEQQKTALEQEVTTLKQRLVALEAKLNESESNQTDKIEKNLIKSLVIGYVVSGNPNDKNQVLRMIASVLDFDQSESDRVNLNKQQTGWLSSMLSGSTGGNTTKHSNASQENVMQAFVKFLEQESQPKDERAASIPNLLSAQQVSVEKYAPPATSGGETSKTGAVSADITDASTPTSGARAQSAYLNSHILNEFTPMRSSSSILKDILSDS